MFDIINAIENLEVSKIKDFFYQKFSLYNGVKYRVDFFLVLRNVLEWNSAKDYCNNKIEMSFFEENNNLRWNHYLHIFILDEEDISSFKEKIESDTYYCRKQVVDPKNAKNYISGFDNKRKVFSSDLVLKDISSIWEDALISGGLNFLIEKDAIQTIVNNIKEDGLKKTISSSKKIDIVENVLPSRLHSIDLGCYSKWPSEKNFNFGRVNLIFGSNGVGKTSLLEAIELLICSSNKRSSRFSNSEKVVIRGNFGSKYYIFDSGKDGNIDQAKRRNLKWYNKSDRYRSSLTESFSKYNFFSTDAAAFFAVDQKDEKDFINLLTKLIAGDDASVLWDKIIKVQKKLTDEIRAQTSSIQNIEKNIALLERDLKNIGETTNIEIMLKAYAKKYNYVFKEAFFKADTLERFFDYIIKYSDIMRDTNEFKNKFFTSGLDFPKDSSIVGFFASKIHIIFELKKDSDFMLLERNKLSLQSDLLSQSIAEKNAHISQFEMELSKLIKYEEIILDRNRLSCSLNSFKDGFEQEFIFISSELEDLYFQGVDVFLEKYQFIINKGDSLRSVLFKANADIEYQSKKLQDLSVNIKRTRALVDESYRLQRDLINSASGYLHLHDDHDDMNCPVCGTYLSIDLIKNNLLKISGSYKSNIEESLNNYQKDCVISEEKHKLLLLLKNYLTRFLENSSFEVDETIDFFEFMVFVFKAKELYLKCTVEMKENDLILSDKFRSSLVEKILNEQSFSVYISDFESIYSALSGYLIKSKSNLVKIADSLDQVRIEIKKIDVDLQSIFKENFINSDIIPLDDNDLREAKNILSYIDGFDQHTKISIDKNGFETYQKHLINIKFDLSEIISKKHESSKLEKMKIEKMVLLSDLSEYLKSEKEIDSRMRDAFNVLDGLVKSHHLDEFVKEDLMSINSIAGSVFSAIHYPHEFGVNFNENDKYLFDLKTGRNISLDEVSTGQRAAFVLSIFLTMNSRLKKGPNLLMFDDPVAHIDDLNSLSFFDYLRDVVLHTDRQIFYATADQKVAKLFERKFGFLGDDFKRIDLKR